MDISSLVDLYVSDGYELVDAYAKIAQDVILYKISKSSMNENVTIKGGVVMHNIFKDKRRATRDIDIDFIRYSLNDDAIIGFIEKLNSIDDEININIVNKIEKLHHQDYDGKRVYVSLIDKNNYRVDTKLDIGVHKNLDIMQEKYCFELDVLNKSVTLFINSMEQMFSEKLKSLVKFGSLSTRYKDVFDFYYLINFGNLDRNKLEEYVSAIIFSDETLNTYSFDDIYNKISLVFNNKRFIFNLSNVKVNWLDVPIKEVISCILNYIEAFIKIEVYIHKDLTFVYIYFKILFINYCIIFIIWVFD